jgi:hypothetical protein
MLVVFGKKTEVKNRRRSGGSELDQDLKVLMRCLPADSDEAQLSAKGCA